MLYSRYILMAVAVAAVIFPAKAQLSIGTESDPERAALLQLKTQEAYSPASATGDANVTSAKGGLLFPRVKLVNPRTLEPMVPVSDDEWKNSSQTQIKERSAGLLVYNLTDNADFKPGLYLWNGAKWVPGASNGDASNGISKNDTALALGGKLIHETELDCNGSDLSIEGTGLFRINTPTVFNSGFKIPHRALQGRFLTSDARGNASWQRLNAIASTPAAVLGKGTFIRSGTNALSNTGAYIVLPPGRWLVMVAMLASVFFYEDASFWLESTFILEGDSKVESSYFEEGHSKISGKLGFGYNILSGHVIMINPTDQPLRFYYHAGNFRQIKGKKTEANVGDFGASKWGENSIVAFSLID